MTLVDAWPFDYLPDCAAVAAYIGARVFPIHAYQNATFPYVVCRRTSTQRSYTTRRNNGLPTARFEVTVWDEDFANGKAAADAVRQAIDGYQVRSNAYQIRSVFIEDESDVPNWQDYGFEKPTYGVQFTLAITSTENVPTYTPSIGV